MVSPTSIGKLLIQDDGDTEWGPATEANLNRLEEMIASEFEITSTGGAVSLTNSDYIANQARRAILRATGSLASNLEITAPVPSSAKLYVFINDVTANGFLTYLRFGSGAYLTMPNIATTFIVGLPDGTSYFATPPVFNTTGVHRIDDDPNARQGAVSRGFVEDRVTILLDRDLQTPPVSPTTEDTYIVAGPAGGDWTGREGEIARWSGSTWIFSDLPAEGLLAWVVDEGKLYASDGGSLIDLIGAGGVADGSVTAAKLASNAVETDKILDANVTEAKIADTAVALAKLKSDVYASESEAKTGTSTTKIPAVANVKHAAFPAGTVMIFRQSNAPTGWTKITASINNSALRVVTDVLVDGGTLDFSTAFAVARGISGSVGNTTLTESQIPAHYHLITSSGGSTDTPSADNYFSESRTGSGDAAYTAQGRTASPDRARSGSTGGSTAHTHSLSMNSLAMDVKFLDVIAATKDAP